MNLIYQEFLQKQRETNLRPIRDQSKKHSAFGKKAHSAGQSRSQPCPLRRISGHEIGGPNVHANSVAACSVLINLKFTVVIGTHTQWHGKTAM